MWRCQIHHLLPWSEGGSTDQDNGGLFCWLHHREIEQYEHEAYYYRGRIWLTPPTRLHPHRRPLINHTHRPPPPTAEWPPDTNPGPAP